MSEDYLLPWFVLIAVIGVSTNLPPWLVSPPTIKNITAMVGVSTNH
jgi:hypothetical protein